MNKKIILLLIINTFDSMGYSLIAPLFPVIGEKISLSENVLGWIISLYSLADFIITPFTLQLIFKLFLIEIYYIHILNISDEISSETQNFFHFFNFEMFTNFVPTLIFQIAQTYYFPS